MRISTYTRFKVEKIVGKNLGKVLYLQFDDFSQFYIHSKYMHHNEWCENQRDKGENSRIS